MTLRNLKSSKAFSCCLILCENNYCFLLWSTTAAVRKRVKVA